MNMLGLVAFVAWCVWVIAIERGDVAERQRANDSNGRELIA